MALSCANSDYDTPPRLVFGTRPLYPIGRGLNGDQGTVEVTFDVTAEGHAVPVSRWSDEATEDLRWFAAHAAVAMQDWVLTPAKKGDVAITTRCRLRFNYVIQ